MSNHNIIRTTIAEIQVEHSQLSETVPKTTSAGSETLLFVFFGLAGLGTIATFITREIHQKKEQREVRGKLTKIPCPNCKYFSKSSYLRCAVQPKLTMTDAATQCSDFISQNQK